MQIYLREEPEVVAGMEDAYAHAVEHVVYPILAESPVMTMRPVGAFRVDSAYGRWPNFVFLWSYDDGFTSYARGRTASSPEVGETGQLTRDPRMIDYVGNAGTWRQRSMEKLLVPLPFSPLPPPLPERTSSGSVMLDQQISTTPGQSAAFLQTFEEHVLAGCEDSGLRLELFACTAGRPSEFHALWSLPSWDHWAAFQDRRHDADHFLPGIERLWPHLQDLAEETLFPFAFSPLGGSA